MEKVHLCVLHLLKLIILALRLYNIVFGTKQKLLQSGPRWEVGVWEAGHILGCHQVLSGRWAGDDGGFCWCRQLGRPGKRRRESLQPTPPQEARADT